MEDKPVVRLASVTSRDVDQIEEYTATVEAEAKNNIAPTSPGRIDRIFVEVGDHVSKGQKLVQMDAANLKQMKLQLENEETEFRRMDELYKVGGASKSEWDAAKTALDVRRTSYNNLLENTQLLSLFMEWLQHVILITVIYILPLPLLCWSLNRSLRLNC